jgi:hypothetical protein
VEAEAASPLLAAQALAYYRRLYDVEERAKTLSAADRLALRQQESTLIWQELEAGSAGDPMRRLLPKKTWRSSRSSAQWRFLRIEPPKFNPSPINATDK